MYYRNPPIIPSETPKYSDKFKAKVQPNLSLSNIPTNIRFFPEELHDCIDKSLKKKKKLEIIQKDIDWSKKKERNEDNKETELSETDEIIAEYDEEAEEDDNDYVENHYDEGFDEEETGNGGGGGSDND